MKQINSTRFQEADEFAAKLKEINLADEKYPAGGVPLLVRDGKAYVDDSDSHSLIFGATGSKKTRLFVFPTIEILSRAGESFVTTDPKGEIFERTAGEAQACGHEVVCLNMRDFEQGSGWNPLAIPYEYYHNGNKAKAMEMIVEFARLVIDENSISESFWSNAAIDVVIGLILYLFETSDLQKCTLKTLIANWQEYMRGKTSFVRKVKNQFGETMIMNKLSMLDNSSEKTVGSVEAIVATGINKFVINEKFLDYISRNEIDLENLVTKKVAIYIVIPDENTAYHFLASLFVEQCYEVLIREAHKSENNQLPIRMNFVVDEFANIPRLTNMEAMITAARSRNIRFHLIIQSINQMKDKYDKAAEVIYSNCNNWIYLYSKEFELLQMISRLCGDVIYESNMRVPLLSEFDLQHLNKEEGEALILAGRGYPFISNLADIDDYPYEIRPFKMPVKDSAKSYVEQLEMIWKNLTEEKWYVVVLDDYIIMDDFVANNEKIRNRQYVYNKLMDICRTIDADMPELHFPSLSVYVSNMEARKRYYQMQKEYPSQTTFSLEELDKSNFKKLDVDWRDTDSRNDKRG